MRKNKSLIKFIPRHSTCSIKLRHDLQKARRTLLATGTAFQLKHRDALTDACVG
jgi:hypothetical protein